MRYQLTVETSSTSATQTKVAILCGHDQHSERTTRTVDTRVEDVDEQIAFALDVDNLWDVLSLSRRPTASGLSSQEEGQ